MIGIANVEAEFLTSFCTLALNLYPDMDWDAVEPKLECSWKRLHGDSGAAWRDVCESVRARWAQRL